MPYDHLKPPPPPPSSLPNHNSFLLQDTVAALHFLEIMIQSFFAAQILSPTFYLVLPFSPRVGVINDHKLALAIPVKLFANV